MHQAVLFFASGWRTRAVDPSVWIGVMLLAVQRLGLICRDRRRVRAHGPAAHGPEGIRRSATARNSARSGQLDGSFRRMRAMCSITRAPILIRRSRIVANSAVRAPGGVPPRARNAGWCARHEPRSHQFRSGWLCYFCYSPGSPSLTRSKRGIGGCRRCGGGDEWVSAPGGVRSLVRQCGQYFWM
jgi:hypothetical protein